MIDRCLKNNYLNWSKKEQRFFFLFLIDLCAENWNFKILQNEFKLITSYYQLSDFFIFFKFYPKIKQKYDQENFIRGNKKVAKFFINSDKNKIIKKNYLLLNKSYFPEINYWNFF